MAESFLTSGEVIARRLPKANDNFFRHLRVNSALPEWPKTTSMAALEQAQQSMPAHDAETEG